ncbi:MAG: NAD(P)-dependent glycerol-3-phosphate dehydrogenase [bacterium]|nr:NAD(P)-dependent glycerol-3-phosphate dehydrogenase [bacterium]
MSEIVAILGSGSWGMAMAHLLNRNGCQVTLWEFDIREYNRLLRNRTIEEKLPGFALAPEIQITNDLTSAIAGAQLLVGAVPSQVVRPVLERIGPLRDGVGYLNLAKGIETDSLLRMSQLVAEALRLKPEAIATLSGPSHAEEVIADMPTTVVIAGQSGEYTANLQKLFSGDNFRVYGSDDIVGVELGGSLKNIIAIAAGISAGLGMGDNTFGALLTRGLAEITRLGVAMGADPKTFAGLSGLGDLITTCSSRHSRNRLVGERLGRGEKLDEIIDSMAMVAEGVLTTRSGKALAEKHGVEMPITGVIYQVLFEEKNPAEAVSELMGRGLKTEVWK